MRLSWHEDTCTIRRWDDEHLVATHTVEAVQILQLDRTLDADLEQFALPDLICVRCGEPLGETAPWYEVQEKMHWICFHYEFEHSGDPDLDCDVPGCVFGGEKPRDVSAGEPAGQES